MSESRDPVEWYRRMRRLRRFEMRAAELVGDGEINGPVHEYIGEEAVAVGVCAALRADDVITSTHRGHGHILAKGGAPDRMFAELLGRESGYNRGRGGSMHIADFDLGIYGANGIVGAGAPMACGAAFTFKVRGEDRVAVPFFGDGAMNQGVLLESFNLAVILHLPVVLACENNGYAITSSIREMLGGDLARRAEGFGLPAQSVDGMDVCAVHAASAAAVERARAGGGPPSSSSGPPGTPCTTSRPAGACATTARRRRLRKHANATPSNGSAGEITRGAGWEPGGRDAVDDEIEREIEGAVGFARNSPRPRAETALDYMYADTYPDFPAPGWEH